MMSRLTVINFNRAKPSILSFERWLKSDFVETRVRIFPQKHGKECLVTSSVAGVPPLIM